MGAGLTGLSTAFALEQLGLDYVIVEKESHIGGLCSTVVTDEGFVFDRSIHVLHMRFRWVKNLIERLLNENGATLVEHVRKAEVYFEGEHIPYPFQSFFYLLSNKQVVDECIHGINESRNKQKVNSQNFEQYIECYFGYGIAKHFMLPYNEKLWTIPLCELSCEWAERFVPKPDPNEILHAAANVTTSSKALNRDWGYNSRFWYPERGGIQNIPEAIFRHLRNGKLTMKREIEAIDVRRKQALLDDGDVIDYDAIVSTMPLPLLLKVIQESPSMLKEIANNMGYVSIFNLNFGINRKTNLNAHWIYFPQRDIIFHRVGFPSTLSPEMAPKDCSSLAIEVSYSKFKPIGNKEKVKESVIQDLVKTGIIKSGNEIISELENDLTYAYILYDMNYISRRTAAHAFLKKHDIYSIGRFGSWRYLSMEDAIVESYETATHLGDTLR